LPTQAFFSQQLGEFVLPYEPMRTETDPETVLLAFLQSTYEAAAVLAKWDHEALERPEGGLGVPPLLIHE
jgi:Family of unknown function (DUF5996)